MQWSSPNDGRVLILWAGLTTRRCRPSLVQQALARIPNPNGSRDGCTSIFWSSPTKLCLVYVPRATCLYFGTGIQYGGHDRNNNVGPEAGEVVRVYPDDSWDLVMGRPRKTSAGIRVVNRQRP